MYVVVFRCSTAEQQSKADTEKSRIRSKYEMLE